MNGKNYLFSSSILSANFACLGDEISQVISAGVDIIHFDIMDNCYVPNLTFGPLVLESLRNFGICVPIDIHVMAKPIERLIMDCVKIGVNCVIFHPETVEHVHRSLQIVKEKGIQVGLAFNPTTSLHYLEYVLDMIDVVLLMSVSPGFGNQLFLYSILKKIRQVRRIIDDSKYNIRLGVDGGINSQNIDLVYEFGADMFVVGSAIFNQKNYKLAINTMKKKLEKIK